MHANLAPRASEAGYLDLERFSATPLESDPFDFLIVPNFVRAGALCEVNAGFLGGSEYEPTLRRFLTLKFRDKRPHQRIQASAFHRGSTSIALMNGRLVISPISANSRHFLSFFSGIPRGQSGILPP